MNRKPLNAKAYGHIAHLPASRMGPGDHKCHEGQSRIATEKARDRHDVIVVQEKLDGSCCAIVRHEGRLLALTRAGYLASTSPYEQHHLFDAWVRAEFERFAWLEEGERVIGEWLALAHGTRYQLTHAPFVPFDVMRGAVRLPYEKFAKRVEPAGLPMPKLLSIGPPTSVAATLASLGELGHHGALDPVEGAVWRVERRGEVDFLCKYVRPDKVDGSFLGELTGTPPIWNWRPTKPRA